MATIIHLRNDGRHCYVTQRFELVEYMLLLIAIDLTETGDERAHLREVGKRGIGPPRCDDLRLP